MCWDWCGTGCTGRLLVLSLLVPGSVRKETTLSVQLNSPIMHHNGSGQTVELRFEGQHQDQLEEAARRVFGVAASLTALQSPPRSLCSSSDLPDQGLRASPHLAQPEGSVQASKLTGRVYSRKKPQSKSHLKSESVRTTAVGSVLPLLDTRGVAPSALGSPVGLNVSRLRS